jgi:hypothetical protein
VARLVLTTAGNSCGVIPTAMARENSAESSSERCSSKLVTKIATVSTTATSSSSTEKRRRPVWNAVSGGRSPSPRAIRPNWVSPAVATTTPTPAPLCTTVPINAQAVSSARAVPAATGAVALSTGRDSPVNTASSQASPFASSRRTSAGTTAPSCKCTTSPGTRSNTSTSVSRPSRSTATVCRISECSASAARSARYSLTKPRPMLAVRIRAMMIASVRSSRTNAIIAVTTSRTSRALRSCRPSTVQAWT